MYFFHGFTDELTKTAGSFREMLKGLRLGKGMRSAESARGGLSMGRAALLTAGAGAGAAGIGDLIGKKKGKKEGYNEGTSDVEQVAERARQLGRQEGVLAYHQAIQARLQAAQGK